MLTFGLWAVPVIVPAAFLTGAIVWRSLPEGIPYYGPVAGVLATALTYIVAVGFLAPALIALEASYAGAGLEIIGVGFFAVYIGGFAFVYTFWLTLPLGVVSGHIHERARERLTK